MANDWGLVSQPNKHLGWAYKEDTDGTSYLRAVQSSESMDAIMSQNMSLQADNKNHETALGRLVARLPMVAIDIFLNEYGLDFYNKDHREAIFEKLDSSDYLKFRTDSSTLSKKMRRKVKGHEAGKLIIKPGAAT